jgi:predicted transcriptional regulator
VPTGAQMKTSKERTVFFLESDLKRKAVEYAKKDRRSLTVLINIALEQYLKGVDYSEEEGKEEDVM